MRKKFFNKKTILFGSIAIVAVLLAVGGIALATTIDKIKNNPIELFNPTPKPASTPTAKPIVAPSPTGTQDTGGTAGPSSTPEPAQSEDPYGELNNQADPTIANAPVNILLIGVDWAQERENNTKRYVGKDFNSDVMLLLSIKFNKDKIEKVDMISFPRDSYAPIHGVSGIYKMNFALAAGGGYTKEGFEEVCATVEDQLGGSIPVDYYIAVTMPVVKDLTDAIGGVDYNMDIEFRINGRQYKKGMQHMDGQAVLDYCRVRKNSGTGYIKGGQGDLNRVNRQKKMLVAVFKKLQSTATLADVPKILLTVKGCQTNLTLPQLAAVALHAKDLPDKNISMNTMPGSYAYGVFNRNYVLINQTKRVQLIKNIFGVTVAPMYKYAPEYAKLQWAYMQGEAWTNAISHVLITDSKLAVRKIVDPDYTALAAAVSATNKLMDKYRPRLKASKPVAGTADYTELSNQVKAMQSLAKTIFAKTGYTKVNWYVNVPELIKMSE